MGTKGKLIVGMDVDELITSLNKAFSDEWLAHYQYWIGSMVVKGPDKQSVIAELIQHSNEELMHATSLANRIIQLGGTPVTKPEDWYKFSTCGYDAPDDPYVMTILDQNIKGEQCAIMTYSSLLEKVKDKDPVTYTILLTILQQEVEHEEDLEALKEDIMMLVKRS